MSDADGKHLEDQPTNGGTYAVGFCRPPVHSRFKPGQSGNPSGRVKGSKNLKSLFHQILNEHIPLVDGSQSKNVTKGEAVMRRLVIGALKGDSRSLMTLMRIAERPASLPRMKRSSTRLPFRLSIDDAAAEWKADPPVAWPSAI